MQLYIQKEESMVEKTLKVYSEERPWGEFRQYVHNDVCTVKTLIVKVGQGLSDQRHQNRTELWIFHTSGGKVTLEYPNGMKEVLEPEIGSEILIPAGTWHMLECIESASASLRVTEVSFGNFDEHDEERRFDRYGRK